MNFCFVYTYLVEEVELDRPLSGTWRRLLLIWLGGSRGEPSSHCPNATAEETNDDYDPAPASKDDCRLLECSRE